MPRLNGAHVVAGNGGPVTVDGVEVCPIGTCASWLDDHRAIYQAGRDDRWTIETCDTRTGEIVTVSEQGCNELAADGGRWAAWLAGRGVYGSVGELPNAGLSPVGTDGRGAAGPDGTLAIVTDRQSGQGLTLHAPDETLTWIEGGAPYGLRVLGPSQAVWNGGSIGLPSPHRRPGGQNGVRVSAPDGRTWWTEWLEPHGLVAYPDGSAMGHVIAPVAFHHDAAVVAGRLVVTYSTGVKELPGEIVTVPDVWALPSVSLDSPPAVSVPKIGRPCWLGFFAGAPGATGGWATNTPPWTLPGNCYLYVPDLRVYRMDGKPAFQYVAAEQNGTIEGLDAAVRDARKGGLQTIAYWPRSLQNGRRPVCDVLGLELYCPRSKSPEAFWADAIRLLADVPSSQAVWVVGMCYDNDDLTTRLAELVALYGRLLVADPHISGLVVFSGSGRAGGLQVHPEVRSLWDMLAAGIPSAPPIHTLPVDDDDDEHEPPPDEDDMPIPDDQFQAMVRRIGEVMHVELPHISAVEWEQGARQYGDMARQPKSQGGPERNATAQELMNGALLRSGFTGVDNDGVSRFFNALEPLNQEFLRR